MALNKELSEKRLDLDTEKLNFEGQKLQQKDEMDKEHTRCVSKNPENPVNCKHQAGNMLALGGASVTLGFNSKHASAEIALTWRTSGERQDGINFEVSVMQKYVA